MKLNSDCKAEVDSMNEEELSAYVDFLVDETRRHSIEIKRLLKGNRWWRWGWGDAAWQVRLLHHVYEATAGSHLPPSPGHKINQGEHTDGRRQNRMLGRR